MSELQEFFEKNRKFFPKVYIERFYHHKIYETEEVMLSDQGGLIPKRDEMMTLIQGITRFYEVITDEEIDKENEILINMMFEQKPRDKPVRQPKKPKYVYLLQSDIYYKIGITTDPDKRISDLMTLPPFDTGIIYCALCDDAQKHEKLLHERYKEKRVNGEWFKLSKDDVIEVCGYLLDIEVTV